MTETEQNIRWRALSTRICTVEGCVETIRCKGLCKFHYQRHLEGIAFDAPRNISREGPCLVSGCPRPRRSRGLCAPHYERGRTRASCPACGNSMKASSATCDPCRRAAIAAQLPTEKKCRQCDRTLPMSAYSFRRSREGAAKWRSRCKECERTDARLRAKTADRGDRSKERLSVPYVGLRGYAKKLGIPWAEVVERYPEDNRCEICGRTPQEASRSGKIVRLALDHCHETGRLRGFLCTPCNSGLGYLGDAAERLQAALKYLRRTPTHRRPSSRAPSPIPGQLVIPVASTDGDP